MSSSYVRNHPRLGRAFARSWPHLCELAQDNRRNGLIMLLAASAGLICANLPWTAAAYETIATWVPLPGRLAHQMPGLDMNAKEWVQDGLLTVFFLVIGLDLRQEAATGTLHNPRQAALPLLAAAGGVVAPICIYLAVNNSNPGALGGWAVPTATDVAFSLAALRILAPRRQTGLQTFLMTLAVFDDIIGVFLIAVGYSHPKRTAVLLPVVICLASWYLLVRMRHTPWLLAIPAGLGAWYGLLLTGIHPVLSGVALGFLTPGKPIHGEIEPRAGRFSRLIAPLSALLALPLFSFLSMGIPLGGFTPAWLSDPVFLGITAGLTLGKPLGIMTMLSICSRLGLDPRRGINGTDLWVVAQLCGIGFTMSFLMAELAFTDPHLRDMALMAVIAGSALSSILAAVIVAIGNRTRRRTVKAHHAGEQA